MKGDRRRGVGSRWGIVDPVAPSISNRIEVNVINIQSGFWRLDASFVLLLAMLAACQPTNQQRADVLIRRVVIVSAHQGESPGQQDVLIRNGKIEAVSTDELDEGVAETVVDGTGMYLVPGITDSHHHVSFVPGIGAIGTRRAARNAALVDGYMRQQGRSLLYHGVTQIIDPAPLDGRDVFLDQQDRPDAFHCGQFPNPGGYPGNQMSDEDSEALSRLEAAAADSIASRINGMAESGAICVKLYFEDGFGSRTDWPMPGIEAFREIVREAHNRDLVVLAHANAIDMYQLAISAGVDVLAHGMWNWQWPDDAGEPPVTETLDRVVDSGTDYQATTQVMWGLSQVYSHDLLAMPEFLAVVPANLLAWYGTDDASWFANELSADFPAHMSESEVTAALLYGYDRAKRATRYVVDKGHPLLLASDCPGSATFANQPGLCTYREILALHEAGVTTQTIFNAATVQNAERFGLSEAYGTVEVGKVANLLLLRADPIDDVKAWTDIQTVFLHGRPIPRDSLRADRAMTE